MYSNVPLLGRTLWSISLPRCPYKDGPFFPKVWQVCYKDEPFFRKFAGAPIRTNGAKSDRPYKGTLLYMDNSGDMIGQLCVWPYMIGIPASNIQIRYIGKGPIEQMYLFQSRK